MTLRDWSVAWISKRGLQQLGISLKEITRLTVDEYHSRYFNAEDAKDYVPKVLGLLEKNNNDDVTIKKVRCHVYRIITSNKSKIFKESL